jgi:hypothetical protein
VLWKRRITDEEMKHLSSLLLFCHVQAHCRLHGTSASVLQNASQKSTQYAFFNRLHGLNHTQELSLIYLVGVALMSFLLILGSKYMHNWGYLVSLRSGHQSDKGMTHVTPNENICFFPLSVNRQRVHPNTSSVKYWPSLRYKIRTKSMKEWNLRIEMRQIFPMSSKMEYFVDNTVFPFC